MHAPTAEAFDILQVDKQMCTGVLLPTLTEVKVRYNDLMRQRSLRHCSEMVNCILNAIESCFGSLFEDGELLIASKLQPQFKASSINEKDIAR